MITESSPTLRRRGFRDHGCPQRGCQFWNMCSIICYCLDMAAYLPPGWPAGVHPPGSTDFEASAVAWLLDVVPPDYRLYGVLRRHPIALATMAKYHVAACVQGARQGYRSTRTEMSGVLPAHGVDAVLTAYRNEGRRLVDTAQAVDLIVRALRGEVFKPRLRTEGGRQEKRSGEPSHQPGSRRPSSRRRSSP